MLQCVLIFPIFAIITKIYGNPIDTINTVVYVADDSDGQTQLLCNQNGSLIDNNNLFELLNNERYWFVLARSKSIYGERTWNNVLMQISAPVNGTFYLEFIGENSNDTCVNSEKGQIESNTKSNRVSVIWPNRKGFLEMVFIDEVVIHFGFCYSIDSGTPDKCAQDQLEQFIIKNNEHEQENDTISWLQAHCSSMNPEDFVINDNPKKCVPYASQSGVIETDTAEHPQEIGNKTIVQSNDSYSEINQEENITVTSTSELDLSLHTNRTNRLYDVEEYYANTTTNLTSENQLDQAEKMEMKQIDISLTSTSSNEESYIKHLNIVKQTENVAKQTMDGDIPLFVLHKAAINEVATTINTDIAPSNSELIQTFSTTLSSKNELTDIIININSIPRTSAIFANPTTESELLNKVTSSAHVADTTVSVDMNQETSTSMIETKLEITTTESTTSTSAIPADCPALKDCPFDYCAHAHKFDNHGCPTCNCLQPNKSHIICPRLTCSECLYGHYTDPYGCPVCQCQSRPYPPLGERCPQLNCEPCYFGTVKDEYNCDTCICIRPNRQECPILNCTFGSCKYGSVKDEDDCPTCDCLRSTNKIEVNCSTTISCPICHMGYVKDADGCQTCICKSRGNAPCTPVSSECQCEYGSYLNSDGCETCSCLPDPKTASHQACWEVLNRANFHNISGPTCSSDGSFYARQCDKSQAKCWCVTSNGIPINGFESKPEEIVNCGCAVELYQVSNLRMIGHHLLCLPNGNYDPIQCDGRYCSCVNENGKLIGPTVSIQNRDQLRCVGVYQQLHPERFLLRQAIAESSDGVRLTYSTFSSLCLTHLEQVRNTKITDDHVLIPMCDTNGLYAPVQCDQNERYCWCVDKKTGVEMEGTRRLNARPNCNIA